MAKKKSTGRSKAATKAKPARARSRAAGPPANEIAAPARNTGAHGNAEAALLLQGQVAANLAQGVLLVRARDEVIICANERFERIFGYGPGELLGQPVSVLNAGDSRQSRQTADEIIRVLHTAGEWQGEVHNVKKGGTPFWTFASISKFEHPDHGTVWTCAQSDITDRKHAENALRESEQRFRRMGDSAPVLIWMSGLDKACTWFNKPWLDFVGRSMEQELGNGWTENVYPDDLERCLRTYSAAFDRRQSFTMEYRLRRHDRQYRWVIDNGCPLYEDGDEFAGYVGSCIDITERKQGEQALCENEQRFRLMADSAPVMIWQVGPDKGCTWVSKPWLDFVGRTMDQELGDGWAKNIHPDDFDRCWQTYSTAFDARKPFSMEYRMKRHDGQYRWLLDSGVALFLPDGQFAGYIGSCIDLTERRETERAVAAAYRHLKLAMSAGRMAAWTWDPRTDALTLSENLQEICGISSIDGRKHGSLLIHPDDRSRHDEIVDHALKHATPYQSVVRLTRPDNGQIVWLDLRAVPVTDGAGHVTTLSGVAIDITERKRAEQELLGKEQRLHAILNTAADAIITIDRSGIIQSVNAAAERMFGYRAAEMVGQNVGLLMPSPHREAHDSYLQRYLRTGEKHMIGSRKEVNARRKDGSFFPTELAVSEIEHLGLFIGTHRELTERKQLERDVVEAASLEQRRIGQDLHDTVGQELTALSLLTRDLADTLASDPATLRLVERIAQGLRRSQQELRSVLRGLLPVSVDAQGLMAALADLADRTEREGKVGCTFDCPVPVTVADNLVATHVYLIGHEAVTNAVKHAQARNIRISLTADRLATLQVQDDGIGMPATPTETQGLGLRIMRNRAAIISAALTIGPAPSGGTLVTCEFARIDHGQKDGPKKGARPDRR
jgi:PAS domain S-box-containing protein